MTTKTTTKTTKKTARRMTTSQLNDRIIEINNNVMMTRGDRVAALDELLTKAGFPREKAPDLYQTEMIVLHGGPLRVISVSGEVMKTNSEISDVRGHLPAINIFVTPLDETDLTFASMIWLGGRTQAARHVEILGPSTVFHNPAQPVAQLPRRSAVMATRAPLRVHIDTREQVLLYARRSQYGC